MPSYNTTLAATTRRSNTDPKLLQVVSAFTHLFHAANATAMDESSFFLGGLESHTA